MAAIISTKHRVTGLRLFALLGGVALAIAAGCRSAQPTAADQAAAFRRLVNLESVAPADTICVGVVRGADTRDAPSAVLAALRPEVPGVQPLSCLRQPRGHSVEAPVPDYRETDGRYVDVHRGRWARDLPVPHELLQHLARHLFGVSRLVADDPNAKPDESCLRARY